MQVGGGSGVGGKQAVVGSRVVPQGYMLAFLLTTVIFLCGGCRTT